jgi:ankyrin repeat protein
MLLSGCTTSLERAVETQDTDIVQRAIDSGANVNGNYWTSLKAPVVRAIENDDLPTLMLLHEHGANLEPYSLFIAVAHGSTTVYSYLRDNGLSLNDCFLSASLQTWLPSDFNSIMPAIGTAIAREDLVSVEMLVELGADISTQCEVPYGQDFHYSAILAAAIFGDEDIMIYILSLGADPNTLSTEGKTPLAIAAERGNYAVVKTLLASGAYHSYDLALKQPIEYAIENEDQKVVDLLRYAGAVPPVRQSPMDTISDIATVAVQGAVLVGTVWLLVEGAKYAAYADGSPSLGNTDMSTTSNRAKRIRTSGVTGDVRAGSTCRYKAASGQCYQYDLSKKEDQRLYELDPGAQLRDEIHPGISFDRDLGQYGGGVQF